MTTATAIIYTDDVSGERISYNFYGKADILHFRPLVGDFVHIEHQLYTVIKVIILMPNYTCDPIEVLVRLAKTNESY
jgi:hypothetical protein